MKTSPNMQGAPRALVVGGSLGGLMTGLELLAAGCDVEIFERSEHVLDDRGAGIVMQPETLSILSNRCGLKEDQVGVWLHYRQYLNATGGVDLHQVAPQLMTSWGLLYQAFKQAFPAERYHNAAALVDLNDSGDTVTGHFENYGEREADLMIGADGSRSFVRGRLFPAVEPRYAGYVAWRGVVPESNTSPELLQIFGDHFTFQQMKQSHILCYLIPGPNGELNPGSRRLNWVWYWNVPETELPALMTDQTGKQRGVSLPPGSARPDVIDAQNAVAEQVLCPQFRQLWEATKQPFLQPIVDLSVPKMVVNRICLVGDSGFVPRPHTAASTSKAAANAIALGAAVGESQGDIDAALRAWEPGQLELGRYLEHHGIQLGNRSQSPQTRSR